MRILALLLVLGQGDAASNAKRWVEALGSEDPAARRAAELEILRAGAPARASLEPFLDHPELEVRGRLRQLLSRIELLPVEPSLREPLRGLEREEPGEIREALSALLAADRERVKEALRAGAAGSPSLAFRSAQLLETLSSPAVRGLRYGALVPRAVYGPEERIEALEFWVNESDRALRLWDVGGHPKQEYLEPTEDPLAGSTFYLEEPHGRFFTLEPGKPRVALNPHPFAVWKAAPRGRYALVYHYDSTDQYVDRKERAGFWTGSLRSARVVYRVP